MWEAQAKEWVAAYLSDDVEHGAERGLGEEEAVAEVDALRDAALLQRLQSVREGKQQDRQGRE